MSNSLDLRVCVTPGEFCGTPHFLASHDNTTTSELSSESAFRSRFGTPSGIEGAHIALFPFDLAEVLTSHEELEKLRKLVAANANQALRTICVLRSDFSRPLSIGAPDSLTLRSSMIRGLDYKEEYPVPTNFKVKDFPIEMRTLRRYTPKPKVGFMGSVPSLTVTKGEPLGTDLESEPPNFGYVSVDNTETPLIPTPVNIGSIVRSRSLKALKGSTLVDSDIVVRGIYYGFYPEDLRAKFREEYVVHLLRNDYILCVRGAGNYSLRLFETVAAGRIPVIVDTNLVMPLADVIPWKDISVWVPNSDIGQLDEYVSEFHHRLGANGHREIQDYLRHLYTQYLSRDGLDRYLESFLLDRVSYRNAHEQ